MRMPPARPIAAIAALCSTCLVLFSGAALVAQQGDRPQPNGAASDPKAAAARPLPDLARVKQEEALGGLESLEDMMDRVSRLLVSTDPQNAAKLQMAFQRAREGMVREKMEKVVKYLEERNLSRAVDGQAEIEVDLQAILEILLEKDLDPRELLRHIRRIRDMLSSLDQVIREETAEKLASDDAETASAEAEALRQDIARLEDLIRRQGEIEKQSGEARSAGGEAGKEAAEGLAGDQRQVRDDTKDLREGDARRQEEKERAAAEAAAKPSADANAGKEAAAGEGAKGEAGAGAGAAAGEGAKGEAGEGAKGEAGAGAEGGAGKPGEAAGPQPPTGAEPGASPPGEPPAPKAGAVLDRKTLEKAEELMKSAESAMRAGDLATAARDASDARSALEEAVRAGGEKIERLRRARDFAKMKEEQEATRGKTDSLADRLKEPPPLGAAPDGTMPGRQSIAAASQEMGSASGELGQGRPGRAKQSQQKALDNLNSGRQDVEQNLEQLQQALRDRMIAYLKEKFTLILTEQRAIRAETRSLDLKLKARRLATAGASAEESIDRKDRQLARALAQRETKLHAISKDVIDLLIEDGTSIVFPEVVVQVADDIENVSGLLDVIDVGDLTQRVERDIEDACAEILRALEEAQKNPPPPNPNQGRQSRSGAAPLLAKSQELKMVRALQLRVNQRTEEFHLDRGDRADLSPELKLQCDKIARKQKETEDLLRKVMRGE